MLMSVLSAKDKHWREGIRQCSGGSQMFGWNNQGKYS